MNAQATEKKMKRALSLSLPILAVAAFCIVALASGPSDAKKAEVTFTRDVAPIFFNNCVQCHRLREIAPRSLLTDKDARPRARSLKEKGAKHAIPPPPPQ